MNTSCYKYEHNVTDWRQWNSFSTLVDSRRFQITDGSGAAIKKVFEWKWNHEGTYRRNLEAIVVLLLRQILQCIDIRQPEHSGDHFNSFLLLTNVWGNKMRSKNNHFNNRIVCFAFAQPKTSWRLRQRNRNCIKRKVERRPTVFFFSCWLVILVKSKLWQHLFLHSYRQNKFPCNYSFVHISTWCKMRMLL